MTEKFGNTHRYVIDEGFVRAIISLREIKAMREVLKGKQTRLEL